jgi:hypothetical protein
MSRIQNQTYTPPPTPFERYISDRNKEGSGLIACTSILALFLAWDQYNQTNSLKPLDQQQLMHQAEPELKQAEPQPNKPPSNLKFFLEPTPPPRSIFLEDLYGEENPEEIEQRLREKIYEMHKSKQKQLSPFI